MEATPIAPAMVIAALIVRTGLDELTSCAIPASPGITGRSSATGGRRVPE